MYVKIIQNVYNKVRTSIKSECRETKDFAVKGGIRVHQRSTLSLYLFALFMDDLMKSIQNEAP